ncbi:hypothetical protein FACS189427_04260 [Planctomycetales bacterium]|nr:hypothetical protein FACS189427_04260 [Planctomycetales bacterium]
MIELELAKIIITEMNNQQVLVLKEKNGTREFPIVIGIFEATAIDRRVKNVPSPRPLTHNLICNAVEILGGTLQDVYIHRLEEQTYFASLRIVRGDELLELDCRPSDAVALAVSFDPWLPILIEENVLEQAAEQSN